MIDDDRPNANHAALENGTIQFYLKLPFESKADKYYSSLSVSDFHLMVS